MSLYTAFTVAKRSGGTRRILAPGPELKLVQRWILDHVLAGLDLHGAAHGFRAGRSVLSNAAVHAGRHVVVNLDLADFFPSISFPRVVAVFRDMGLAVAVGLALLCTADLGGARCLPQGAPTSPAIANLVCRPLDSQLHEAACRQGFDYTRYADDLSFSSLDPHASVAGLIASVTGLVGRDGFRIRSEKTAVMRIGQRQTVTGLVVNNARPSVTRGSLRRFRAALYQIERDGPSGKHWGGTGDVLDQIAGFAAWVTMIDREKGSALRARVRGIRERYAPGGGS